MVDLFSISSSVNALQGVDYALYLVHSMQPSTRLNQGNFEDTDLLLADNFSRAAETCKLKHIVYVGGILPKDDLNISKHLKSRFEVEQVLASRSTPLTAVRAGIIIGPGGSSFRIVKRLVQNTSLIGFLKILGSNNKSIKQIFGDEKFFNLPIEIGGSEIVTYMDILKITAKEMKRKRWIFSIPFFSLGMSKLWVGLFSGSNKNFVSPLIESLRHDMTLKTSISLKNLPSFTLKNEIFIRSLFDFYKCALLYLFWIQFN